jgi:hypothetical protein
LEYPGRVSSRTLGGGKTVAKKKVAKKKAAKKAKKAKRKKR